MSAGDIVFKTGEIPRIVGPTSDVYFVLIDDDNAEQIELDANLRGKNKDIIDI